MIGHFPSVFTSYLLTTLTLLQKERSADINLARCTRVAEKDTDATADTVKQGSGKAK